MRYTNIRTGAIVDSPFKIYGDDWEVVEVERVPELTEEIETEEVNEVEAEEKSKEATDVEDEAIEETEEYVEEEVDLTELKNKELEDLAKEQGIELTTADKKNKDTRIAAIVAGLE